MQEILLSMQKHYISENLLPEVTECWQSKYENDEWNRISNHLQDSAHLGNVNLVLQNKQKNLNKKCSINVLLGECIKVLQK